MTAGQTVAVVTSRLRRLVRPHETWLVALRGILRLVADRQEKLIIGKQTAGAAFIHHAALRLTIPCEFAVTSSQDSGTADGLQSHDKDLINSAQTIYVLTLRSNGNLHALLRERLQRQPATVVLVDLPGLQAKQAREELVALGARTWQPKPDQCLPFSISSDMTIEHRLDQGNLVYELVPFPHRHDWMMLTHTTRACPGPWPGEAFETYADSLLESWESADHSSLGALRRIVQQRRLIASALTIRAGFKVVSFTAVPLSDLSSLHQFRPHRVRWDFEPYGICIRRQWLIDRGARPVVYANHAQWKSLSEADRPFFQLAASDSVIDWSVEQEWRHAGDLDLCSLTANDALVFVPDFEAAKAIAPMCPWPITLWPDHG